LLAYDSRSTYIAICLDERNQSRVFCDWSDQGHYPKAHYATHNRAFVRQSPRVINGCSTSYIDAVLYLNSGIQCCALPRVTIHNIDRRQRVVHLSLRPYTGPSGGMRDILIYGFAQMGTSGWRAGWVRMLFDHTHSSQFYSKGNLLDRLLRSQMLGLKTSYLDR